MYKAEVSNTTADRVFRGVIARVCAEENVTRVIFAEKSGFSEPHLRRMLDAPGTTRLSDLRGIVKAYDVTDEEIVRIVRGRRA